MEQQKIPFFAKPPDYFFPRNTYTEHDEELFDPPFVVKHGFKTFFRETFLRRRSLRELVSAARGENKIDHALEGIDFAHRMDIADRAANGLRLSLAFHNKNQDENHQSDFGVVFNYGYNNPELADHNHPHFRRVERFIEAMLLNIGELRHSQSVKHYIDALYLYANFHDTAQVYNLQFNLLNLEKEIKDVKKGHGLEAAIMLLLFHRRYAIERKVDIHTAWNVCAQAATIIMIHDDPNKFMKILNSDMKASELIKGIENEDDQMARLAEVFDKNKETEVDIFSLTPRQLLHILGKIKEDKVNYGLPESLVEEYEAEIKEILDNNAPLIFYSDEKAGKIERKIGMPEEERKAFNLAAEVALMADLLDMRIPGEESIFRTLRAQKSKDRQFIPVGFDEQSVLQQIFDSPGDFPPDSPFNFDVLRILWEAANIEKIINGLPDDNSLLQSQYLRKIIKDASITSVLSLREICNRLMRKDFSVVDEVFARRRGHILEKAETRTGKDLMLRSLLDNDLYQVLEKEDSDLLIRVREILDNLEVEKNAIKENLEVKISTNYSEESVAAFDKLIEKVLESLYKKYKVSNREKRKYESQVLRHKQSRFLPYNKYESIGIFPPKTLVEPIGLLTIGLLESVL